MSGESPLGRDIARLSGLIGRAHRLLVFTGAGISTASGIPDYRGPQGVWTTRTPVFYDEFMTSESARRRYWEQKLEDREAFGAAMPNAVHHSIHLLEGAGKLEAVVTQNVDGLHAAAGTSPGRLVELHGTTRLVECQRCGDRSEPAPHFAEFGRTRVPPMCPCGGPLKPATISFGQALRAADLRRAAAAAEACDLVIALGSTLSVTPASSIPLSAARRGAPYVIVNRGRTDHDGSRYVTVRIEGDVIDIVPPAVAMALGEETEDPRP